MKKQTKTPKPVRWWIPTASIAVLAAVMLLLLWKPADTGSPETQPDTTAPSGPSVQPLTDPIDLGQGLRILRIDRYAGLYMEDGSNETVSDVMMLILENTGSQDLQLARVDIAYSDFTAEFEVTNLPAGERAVLLERNRHAAVTAEYLSASARNVVFFPEPMALEAERLELSGEAGLVQVTNISGAELSGPIYIYYKNRADDLYYGGITYRVTISEGLAAGETLRIPAGHYHPDNCRFVMATCGA